jgi:hypothetical protein
VNIIKDLFLALIIFITLNPVLYGQEIVTDRPDQTESPVIIPKKSLQIETGFLTGNTNNNNASESQLLVPTMLLRYGLSEKIEIRIIDQLEKRKSVHYSYNYFGLSDLIVGTKIQIFKKEGVNADFAFLTYLILPTGADGLTNNKPGTSSKIAVSHSINDLMDIGYNLGYDNYGYGNGNLTYSVSLGAEITKKIGFFIEDYGELTDLKILISNIDTGFTYLLYDNFQLDLSSGFGLNQKMNFFSVGFSWNIRHKHSN